jgi:hypothetical protein
MKHYVYVLLLLFVQNMQAADTKLPDNEIDQIITQLINEIKTIRKEYDLKKSFYYKRLQQISSKLTTTKDLETKVDLLIKKDAIQNQLQYLARSEQNNIQKIRYLKGLSVIKLLYEKVLGLDHHFSSLVTFNEINKISNPNNYPEFEKVKDIIKQKTDKKKRLPLTTLLGQNMYTTTIDMFIGLFSADVSPKEKKEELENVQCILDFTLRMNNDLKTIYFETTFLQKSNEKIKQDLEILFKSYTKPIGYYTSLQECRMNDDWDTVREKLNAYIDKMEKLSKNNDNPLKYRKMIINLNFPIDRLLQFINEYNIFIDQGVKYYEKFKIILDSYENEKQCATELPPSYKKLKADIDIAIDKFNTAYRPVEINGSKMKEILYGINEYE